MKNFIRKHTLNYFFFPLLVIASIFTIYVYGNKSININFPLFSSILLSVYTLTVIICTILILNLGHLGNSIYKKETERIQTLIDSMDSNTKNKIFKIFLDKTPYSIMTLYKPLKYYIFSVFIGTSGLTTLFILHFLYTLSIAPIWIINTFKALFIITSVIYWIYFNFFKSFVETSLKTITRLGDRCLYYAGENLLLSQIFSTITNVIDIFNKKQDIKPVIKRILNDCMALLNLDAAAMEIHLKDYFSSVRNVVVPTPKSVKISEDFYKHVRGRSEINNNIHLSKAFDSITKQGFNSIIYVAIEINGKNIGYLAGFLKRKDRDFLDTDLEFLYTFGKQTGLLIENAYFMEKVKRLSITDGLTGLNNIRYLNEAINVEMRRAVRYKKNLCVAMIDVDNFKNYNDTNGHPAGDLVLKKISKILLELTRDTDIVARYGGEEFILVLTETTKEGGVEFAQRLCKVIENEDFDNQEAQPGGKLTISIGVSSSWPDSTDPKELIKLADKALYKAKENGRNQVISYSEDM